MRPLDSTRIPLKPPFYFFFFSNNSQIMPSMIQGSVTVTSTSVFGESIAIPTTKGPITIINQNTGAKQTTLRLPASGKANYATSLASLIRPYGSLFPTGIITVSANNATASRLTIYSLSSSESLSFSAPEPLTCLTTTNTGLCLAGGSSGRIYIWKVCAPIFNAKRQRLVKC